MARPRQGSRTTSGRLEMATCPVERRPGAKIERSEMKTCRLLVWLYDAKARRASLIRLGAWSRRWRTS